MLGDTSATSEFAYGATSGKGWAGGDFNFQFSLLWDGDVDLNGIIEETDYDIVMANQGMLNPTWADGDLDGDNDVDNDDVDIVATQYYVTPQIWPHGLHVTNIGVDNTNYVGSLTHVNVPTMEGSDAQLRPLPIQNFECDDGLGNDIHVGVNQIKIAFDRPFSSTIDDTALLGLLSLTCADTGVTYYPTSIVNVSNHAAFWNFDQDFQYGHWVVTLSDNIYDQQGISLDGDWDGPSYIGDHSGTSDMEGDYGSGDGEYGGDFVFAFTLLIEGDCNSDGLVDAADAAMNANWLETSPWYEGISVTSVAVANSMSETPPVAVDTDAGTPEQLKPLEVYSFDGIGMNQVILTFNQPVTSSPEELIDDLTIANKYGFGTEVSPMHVTIDRATVVWTFEDSYAKGSYVLRLSDSLAGINGALLDGEWDGPDHWDDTSGTSEFINNGTSGDGLERGDFVFPFSLLLPGDADRDGQVDGSDWAILSENWRETGATWSMGDFSGNGEVDNDDVTIYFAYVNENVWIEAPKVIDIAMANSAITGSEQSVPTAANNDIQLRPLLARDGIDQVTLTFTQPIDSSDPNLLNYLTITDERGLGTEYPANAVSVNGSTVTWTFSTSLVQGEFVLNLSDAIHNQNGGRLDGEWDGPEYLGDRSGSSQFYAPSGDRSGNGVTGGDFVFAFSLAWLGDANLDGWVDHIDRRIVEYNIAASRGTTWQDGNFTGNGLVSGSDLVIWAANEGQRYWPAPTPAPVQNPVDPLDALFAEYGFGDDDPSNDIDPSDTTEWDAFTDELLELLGLS